jgi:uncharacterized membrane protein
VVFGRLLIVDVSDSGLVHGPSNIALTLTLLPVALIHYYLWWRTPQPSGFTLPEAVRGEGGKGLVALHLWAAAILIFADLGVDIVEAWRPVAWMLLAGVFVALGSFLRMADLRVQGLIAALPAFAVGLMKIFDGNAVLPVSLSLALLFAAQFFLPRNSTAPRTSPFHIAERDGRFLLSVMGTVLLTVLLYHQFPGGWLTTAWGLEGLALLILGFPLRERVFRLEGLALLLFCILKLFLYDLRNLETLFPIMSFIALGIILLGVSLLYTRFGERIRRYL